LRKTKTQLLEIRLAEKIENIYTIIPKSSLSKISNDRH